MFLFVHTKGRVCFFWTLCENVGIIMSEIFQNLLKSHFILHGLDIKIYKNEVNVQIK